MDNRICIIDDGTQSFGFLTEFLGAFFKVQTYHEPNLGLSYIKEEQVDLVILDVMLPGTDWFAIIRKIRSKSDISIVMLSPTDVTDRVVALRMGADACIQKPFEPYELLAIIQAILRSCKAESDIKRILHFKGLIIDRYSERVEVDKQSVPLSTSEYEALIMFVDHPGKVLHREFLIKNLRGIPWQAADRSIDQVVSRLRRKLEGESGRNRFIRTIRGEGYKFIASPNE